MEYLLAAPLTPMTMREQYRLESIHAVDGDTVAVRLVMLHDMRLDCRIRLAGIDAPEIHDDRQAKAAGVAMRAVQMFIDASHFSDLRVRFDGLDKYAGRYIGDLLNFSTSGYIMQRLSDYLLKLECVRPYGGGAKQPWTDEELRKIESLSFPLN